jgi:hypothetical protein
MKIWGVKLKNIYLKNHKFKNYVEVANIRLKLTLKFVAAKLTSLPVF